MKFVVYYALHLPDEVENLSFLNPPGVMDIWMFFFENLLCRNWKW